MAKFEFADFVDEFKISFTAYKKGEGSYNSSGKWVYGQESPVSMEGIILPLSNDEMRFAPNGTYTERSRKVYTVKPLFVGQRIEYNGQSFLIKSEKPYSSYTDIYMYMAEGVEG